MAVCVIKPKPDLYGLGIRLAFYIQWLGAVLIEFLDATELGDVRLLGLLLSAAATLALVVQVAGNNLEAADIYVALLLAAGAWLFLVPVYIWRALSLCSPYWNPLRWSKERRSPFFQICSFAVLCAAASVGVWFYVTFLPARDEGCSEYGFFFGKVDLENKAYIAFNAILYLVILIVCGAILISSIGLWEVEAIFPFYRKKRHVPKAHRHMLRFLRTLSNLVVFAVLVVAVELSIQFNNLQDGSPSVNDLGWSAQLIPLVLSAGIVLRSMFMHFVRLEDDGESSNGGGSRRRSSSARPREKVVYRRTVVEEDVEEGPMPPPPTHRRR